MCLAIPGEIIRFLKSEDHNPLLKSALVRFGHITREVNLTFVPEATIGQYVIVHVGVAISLLDEEAANIIFETLSQITIPPATQSPCLESQ